MNITPDGTQESFNGAPPVSILLPVYNGERWIDGCLESIRSQEFTDFEVVAIDDASTDSTFDRLSRWRDVDARIRIVRNEVNSGVAFSLNRGLRECRAELVARMDADDIMATGRIAKQVAFMRAHPEIAILGGWARIIDTSGVPQSVRRMPITHQAIIRMIWANPIIHPCVMYRRTAIIGCGGYDLAAAQREDYELWFRCASTGLKFHNLPEVLIDYRHDEESFSRYGVRSSFRQFRIGLRGSWRTKVGISGYLGLLIPLIRSLLPNRIQKGLYNLSKRFDPRQQADAVTSEETLDCH